jgi:hypothetical protein
VRDFYFDFIALPRGVVRLRWLVVLLGTVALIAVLVYHQAIVSPKLDAQRSLLAAALQKQTNAKPPSKLKDDELAKAWQYAVNVELQLGLPWASFFTEIGKASKSGDVALISVEPDPYKSNVVLIAEARNFSAMLEFVTALQASHEFSQVTLLSHAIDNTVEEKPIRFRMSANWKAVE